MTSLKFSLVVKLTTIRSVLSIVATENLHLKQLDVKIVLLHGDLEDIYMMQQQEYIISGMEQLLCKLKKSLLWLETSFETVVSEVRQIHGCSGHFLTLP